MKNFQEFQESTRLKRETGTLVKGGTKYQPKSKNEVVDAVKKSIYASGGKIMRKGSNQQKKVKFEKPGGGGKYLKMQDQKKQQQAKNKALDAAAKKAGYKTTQDYVNVQAVRDGGLGT